MSSVPKDSPPPPPPQVYSRRQSSHRPQDDSLLVPDPLSLPAPIVEPNIPIAISKGIRSTRNPYPHCNALSYDRLSQSFYKSYVLNLLTTLQNVRMSHSEIVQLTY